MRAALTMLGIIIGVGCESHGRPWTRSRSLCSSPDYESRDQFVNYHPGRDDRQRRADWISGVSTLTVDDAHEIERRVSNITRVSFATRTVLQAVHENKNWSTVVLGTSNAGIARNCWVLSPVNAQHCVSLRRLCQDEFKTCLVTLGGKHSTADVCKEGELTMVTSGPFPPGRSFRPDPPLPPDPSPFPGPPLPEPTPMPEPPPVPDPSPFPGPPPHMRSEGTAPCQVFVLTTYLWSVGGAGWASLFQSSKRCMGPDGKCRRAPYRDAKYVMRITADMPRRNSSTKSSGAM